MLAVIRTRTQVLTSSRLPVRPRRLSPLGAMAAAVVLLGAIGHPITARGGSLVVEVVPANTNVTVPPGFAGTLELDLLNPSTNTQSFNVAGFQFELQVPISSGVLFTNATTATANYIFAGNSTADSFFGGSLIVSPPPPPPTIDLQGFDTVAASGTSTTLNPGSSFGLGFISFTVDANAAPGIVPVSIIPFDISTAPSGTLISDNQIPASSIPFTMSDGTITIQPGTIVVPEPSTLMLTIVGGGGSILLSLVLRWRDRRGHHTKCVILGSQPQSCENLR
ncbi:MAG: PEP-CTERM sorting domain-containing protein [Isosphaeraceae bacterium]